MAARSQRCRRVMPVQGPNLQAAHAPGQGLTSVRGRKRAEGLLLFRTFSDYPKRETCEQSA